MNDPRLVYGSEVAAAMAGRRPLVALESTLIAHGLPFPRNVETALALEATVRAQGAVPATIAILGGRVRIGLTGAEIERIARSNGVRKLSRRDLAIALARGEDGATTVAATMLCAHRAGIAVFATGGIGGVHRGAESTFDVSADLEELARTPVAVVCAGAKAILDLPKTLEYLETRGVPVLGYRCDSFPAFYTRDSGLAVDCRCDNAAEVAAILRERWHGPVPVPGGVVVTNPIPVEAALDGSAIDAAIERACAEATARAITGHALTPFLLGRMEALTGGSSLAANIALVTNNAAAAAQIAVAYAGAAAD